MAWNFSNLDKFQSGVFKDVNKFINLELEQKKNDGDEQFDNVFVETKN